MSSLKIFVLSFVLLFVLGIVALAQEIPPTEEPTGVGAGYSPLIDENIQPEDLEVSQPQLLPDSPFYFLKNWLRGIRSFFVFNQVKKAELKMKIANEKLMEIKKLVELKKNPEVIKKTIENYQQEAEKLKNQAKKIKKRAKENPQVESFLDKFIHQQTLHQKLLDKLETQVPPQVFEKIKEARERHLERFKDVMLKLEDRREKIGEKLAEILEKQKGSQFKNFKNLEILADLEEKVPEGAKEAIKKAQENALKRLQGDLEKMSPEGQEKFKEYIEKISGKKERHLEILENLRQEIQTTPTSSPKLLELKEKLDIGKEKIIEKIKEESKRLNCPPWTPPVSDFCKKGRVVVKRDKKTGCPLAPRCLVPGEIKIPKPVQKPIPKVSPKKPTEPTACIALWDPVCGKDGKTYSNECFAKLAGVKIVFKGTCEEEENPLPKPLPEILPE